MNIENNNRLTELLMMLIMTRGLRILRLKQALKTRLINLFIAAFIIALFNSCADKGLTQEEFNELSYTEAAQLRQDARMKSYRQSYRKQNRRRVWSTYPSYYYPYRNPYSHLNRTKITNKILYPSTWRN